MAELMCQGAEGRVYATTYLGRPAVMKERLSKSYRVKELDTKINRTRILQEARCIVKCRRAGVATPSVYLVDLEKNRLYLERIVGRTIKDILWAGASDSEEPEEFRQRSLRIAKNVGQAVGRMHDADVVHGDLTTSNLMVREDTPTSASASASTSTSSTAPSSGDAVVVIDFGLGMMKPSLEDKAVDLYVLERAFVSTHPGSEHLVSAALEAYRFCSRKGTPTLQKLEQVRMRGRKRDMTG